MTSSSSYQQKVLEKLLANPVVLDVESTIAAKGNPYNETNKLCLIQVKVGTDEPIAFPPDKFSEVLPILKSASCIIGFNLKFDLAWVRRELGFVSSCVWDCQLAEFMLTQQTWKYPDLGTTCEKYGVQKKLDVVKTEFWDKGIDTPDIPLDILIEYGLGDVQSTWEVFEKQLEILTQNEQMLRLFRLHCNDLLVLQEMEQNGIIYDSYESKQQSANLQGQLTNLESKIHAFTSGIPINLDSRDHVSVLLYGGKIIEDTRIPVGVYKTGEKIGQPRYKIVKKEHNLPRLVDPLKGSELKKEGYFSTDEPTLLSLKPSSAAKKLITWLLERVKIEKLRSTYLDGLPKTIETMGWKPNMLHSNLNQCVASTGRLSSTKPNQQNLPKEAKRFCISRY